MKLTRKQKIQQQRERAAERVMAPIREAFDRGDLRRIRSRNSRT